MLAQVAALSGDASTFQLAVSEILQSWEDGRLASLRTEELRPLFEDEYWLLSSEARRSGFVLKQKLADAHCKESKCAVGYNAMTGKFEDLAEADIIRPLKVVRTALQNAASIAGLLLTMEAMPKKAITKGE